MIDRNFDNLVEKFEQRIHGSCKGQLREDLFWWQMQRHMPEILGQSPLRILDAGGGLGQMTSRLAALGHSLTLNDISAAMLARARQRLATESGTTANIELQQGPIQSLAPDKTDPFDLIVCHALLEWLSDPKSVLQHLFDLLQPGGKMSLAFYNRHALVYANTRKGNLDVLQPLEARRKSPRRKGLSPRNAQYPEAVLEWLATWQLDVLGQCGIRVISDWLPADANVKTDYQRLLACEQYYAELEPYCWTGRYFQIVVQKPTTQVPAKRHD